MKKTQSRISKAIVDEYKVLSKTLSKKAEIMETLSKKFNISTKTVQRILKKDNVSMKKDNDISSLDNNISSSNEHKYRIKSTEEHIIFEDETGREIKDYAEWKIAYERAVNSGNILF